MAAFNLIFQYSTSTPAEGPRICDTLASTTHGTRNSVILSPKTLGKCQCRGTMTLGCSTRELNSMPETTLQCRGTQFWNGNFDMGPYHSNCVRTVKFTCAGGSFQNWSRHWFLHCNTVWDVALTKALCEFGNKNANKQVFERNSINLCNHLLHWTCIWVEYETCWMHKNYP